MNNILVRSLSGGVYVSLLTLGVLFNAHFAFLIFGIVLFIALYEFGKLLKNKGFNLSPDLNIGVGITIYLLFALVFLKYISAFWLGIIPALIIVPIAASLFSKSETSIIDALLTIGGYFYILLPLILVHFLYASNSQNKITDFWPVLGMLILTWTSDTFAYLSGRFFGKNKLFERISPKKTWEGVFGGVIFSIITAFVINYFDEQRSIVFWLILAFVIPITGILGDLFESLIKRTVNVKDSGDFIPGHGGILDRIDAMLFTIPVTYAVVMLNNIW